MKAIAKCPKCGEVITTTCSGCIREGNTDCLEKDSACKCDIEEDIQVKWKKVPETEDELREVEEE